MAAGGLSSIPERAGMKTSDGLCLLVGATSGAALSLSYTGWYLGIYSWICLGALLLSVMGPRLRVAFGCGFLHGMILVMTSVPWIAKFMAVH